MEAKTKNCFFPGHSNTEATIFCQDCKLFMCNKCENIYSEVCKTHKKYKLDKNMKDLFIGLCLEENHLQELSYFCKTHNKLCCANCIAKIKDEKNGQHGDCDICSIKNIEQEKKQNLNENIKKLENMSNNLIEKINELKNIFVTINEKKENLKIKIQKIFTNIRSELNNREEELLLEIDKQFEKNFFNEDIITKGEKLPNKLKTALEKGKTIDKDWNNNKLNSSINNCLIIENYIQDLNTIDTELKKSKLNGRLDIKFKPEENEIKPFIEKIKNFGKIYLNNYSFKQCPINISEDRKFEISGEKQNIFTKTGTKDTWMGTITEYQLDSNIEEHIWKIKILKTTQDYYIMIGIATIDFDFNTASYQTEKNFGWYYCCYDGQLYSGPPQKYSGYNNNLKSKRNEIKVIMNMKKKTLKFIIDNEDMGDSYNNIPIDKPLFPSVLLYKKDDSVEIIYENN